MMVMAASGFADEDRPPEHAERDRSHGGNHDHNFPRAPREEMPKQQDGSEERVHN